MSGSRIGYVEPDLYALDDHGTDLLVLSAFSDERPLTGLNALVDWRLCGTISGWLTSGFATGQLGERILFPIGRQLNCRGLVLFGLGTRAEFRTDRALAVARAAVKVAAGLRCERLTCALFALDQLPSPLSRTGESLIEALAAEEALTEITLVASDEARQALGTRSL